MNKPSIVKLPYRITTLAFVLLMPCVALANNIVYTGNPTGTSWVYSLNSSQSLAAEFSVASSTTITSVQGYMSGLYGDPNTSITINQDGGVIPGSVIYSGTFTGLAGNAAGWQGLSSLNWIIGAGTYWVTFNSASLYGGMAPFTPNPLSNYAFTSNGNWFQTNVDIGVWIQGESNGVPDTAATLALLGGTLLGLVALRRRFVA
jgi:hypothetical protein